MKFILSLIYKIFIRLIVSPNFILNKKKILKKEYLDFKSKGYFLFKNEFVNNFYTKFKNEISLINIDKLIDDNLKNFSNNSAEINSGDKSKLYAFSINKFFRPEFINEIYVFLKNEIISKEIFSRSGFGLVLTDFQIFLNHYNPKTKEEGPKLWHRDDDSIAGQLKLFFILNNLNEKSDGFFYFIPRNIIKNYNKLTHSIERKKNNNTWDKFRNTDEEIKKIIDLDNSKIIYGNHNPELLIIDTNDCYHKGGYIKSRACYRIMIQAIYSPTFNISLLNNLYKKSFLYKKTFHILRFLKNRLRTAI
jgi:hypothetical protein